MIARDIEKKYEYGVIVKDSNRSVIEVMLRDANKYARERKITYEDITRTIEKIEKRYIETLRVSKKSLNGSVFYIDVHAQSFASSYKGVPMSSQFSLLYKDGEFRVVETWRGVCKAPRFRYSARLTDKAKEDLVKNNLYI